MYIVLFVGVLSFGFYSLATQFIILPSGRTSKTVGNMVKKQSVSQQFYRIVTYPLILVISKFIHMDGYRRKQLGRKLKRAEIDLTPEQYQAKAIVTTLLIAGVSLLFLPLGLPVVTMALLMLSVVMFFKSRQSVDEKLEKINSEILKEIPRFIRTYNNTMQSNKDLLHFLEQYRKVAGPAFCSDLDILITDLQTGNMEDALQHFDTRVNIPQISTFVSGVIGVTKGIDQGTFFYLLEKEMQMLSKENLKREIAKRPGKIKKATIAVGVMMFILYLYPIMLDLKNGLGIFN